MVSAVDLAWAAGFLEGEGSFVRKNVKGGTVTISCPQVDAEPLERLRQSFGGSITLAHPPGRNAIRTWRVHGHNAASVMMTLYGLMSARRRERIRECLVQWRASGVPCRFRTKCLRGHEYALSQKNGRSRRHCRTCNRESKSRHYVYKRGPRIGRLGLQPFLP